tara:strand:+ start:1064 stop:2029 length:966 start_codon:yes stop_codon:yes gene_type:complete
MINWGILGMGNIGRKFFECFNHLSPEINLVGYASKSNSKKNSLIFKNLKKFDSYEELIESKSIDAVYISTLNNSHKDLILLALKNDKKILCEKPLAMNLKEVEEIRDALKNKKDTLFEAIAYRSHPQTYSIKKILLDKDIGEVKKIESNFGFKIRKINKESRLFKKEFGGGSIMDLGCYPISFFNLFLDKEKQAQIIESEVNYCETSVDIDAKILLKLNDTIEAKAKVSLRENLQNNCKIYCDNAVITVPEPWLPSNSTYVEIKSKSRYYKEIIKSNMDSYKSQLNLVSNVFKGKLKSETYLVNIDESLKISKIIDLWSKN